MGGKLGLLRSQREVFGGKGIMESTIIFGGAAFADKALTGEATDYRISGAEELS